MKPGDSPSAVPDGFQVLGPLRGSHRATSHIAVERGATRARWVVKRLDLGSGVPLRRAVRSDHLELASFRHPAFGHPLRWSVEPSGCFLLRPYIEGTDVAPALQGLPPRRVLPWLVVLAEAVGLLHRAGLAHGNLKASNALVARGTLSMRSRRSRRIVLCDAAWWVLEEPDPFAADLESLGRVFHRLLSGKDAGESAGSPSEPGVDLGLSHVPLDIARVVRRLLDPDPKRRYQDARALIDDLRRLSGARAPPAPPPVECFVGFVGREADRLRAVDRLASLEPVALAVTGEAGMGKTVFLRRIALEAQLLGYRTVEIRAYAEKSAPFAPLRAAIERLLRSGTGGRTLRRRYKRLLESTEEPVRSLEDPGSRRRFIRGLLDLISESSAGSPTLLAIDDIHHADPLTVDVLAELAGSIASPGRAEHDGCSRPVSLAVSYRSESPFRRCLAPIRDRLQSRSEAVLAIELAPLSDEAVERWMRIARDAAGEADPLADLGACRGNPFAIREVLRTGRRGPPDAGQSRDLASIHEAYLSALGADERRVLEALATLARPAPAELLEEILALPRSGTRQALESLAADGTLARDSGSYFFQHGSLESSISESLSERDSRALHRRIAEVLATDPDAGEETARHWLESDAPANGVPLALESARRLARSHEHRRALHFYRAVLDLLEPSARDLRRRVAEEAAAAHAASGEHLRAAKLVEALLDELPSGSPDAASFQGTLGIYYHRAGDIATAAHHLERALELLPESRDHIRWRLMTESELAEIANNRGEYDRAESISRRALERVAAISEAERDPEVRRQEMVLLETLAHLHLRRFEYREARSLFEESLRAGRRVARPGEEALIHNNLASLHAQESRFRAAIGSLERASKLCLEIGDDQSLTVIHSNLAVLHARMGEPERADNAIRRAARHDALCESRRSRFLRLHSSGMADLLLGRYAAALETFRAAIHLGEELEDRFLVSFERVYLGECHLFRGELKAASAALAAARGEGGREPALIAAMVEARTAALAALRGDAGESNAAAETWERLERPDVAYVDAWNRLFLGWAHRLLGHRKRARSELEASRRFFARVRAPAGEVHAVLELAALDADYGKTEAARARLTALGRRFSPGRGALAHPMLAARFLAYEARVLLDQRHPDLEEASSRLLEAESFLIGRSLRDLETLVRELKRRIRIASARDARPPSLPPDPPGGLTAGFEALESIHGELSDLASRMGAELAGREGARELGRRLREVEDAIRAGRRLLDTRAPEATAHWSVDAIRGNSPAIRELKALVRRAAPSRVPILITGETGSGKELVARAVHGESSRRDQPFVSVSCAALPDELLEAELFGYVAGAFSGAESDREGLLRKAHGGTFLFDEVGELSPAIQGKLLRILDRRTVRPLGGAEEVEIDVRYVFSTNQCLEDLVANGAFRQDLYFRLGRVEIAVPPLRERLEDLPLLVEHFSRQARGDGSAPELDGVALRALASYPWPGNVRELQNAITRLAVTTAGEIRETDIEEVLGQAPKGGIFSAAQLRSRPLDDLHRELEREYIMYLGRDCRGDMKRMAASLGITLRALYVRLRRLGVEPRELREGR